MKIRLQLHEIASCEWTTNAGLRKLSGACLRQLAIPCRSARQQALARHAHGLLVEDDRGETVAAFLATEDHCMIQMDALLETDTEKVSQAWREAVRAFNVRRVEVRSDDSIILPHALHQRPLSHSKRRYDLLYPPRCIPKRAWEREDPSRWIEMNAQVPLMELYEACAQLETSGKIPFVELEAGLEDRTRELMSAGWRKAVVVFETELGETELALNAESTSGC